MAEFVLLPVLIIGIILAIIEIYFVHQDEAGMHPLTHAIHAIPVMFVFIFISMNIKWVLSFTPLKDTFWIEIGIRVVVGIIAMVKISAAAAVAGKVGEKFPHTLAIGVLIMVSPYIWELALCQIPAVKTFIPTMNGCPKA